MMAALSRIKLCVCVFVGQRQYQRHIHLLYSGVLKARIGTVAPGRASSHRSVVTGSSSVSHRQCSGSFWISLLIAVAAGVLTRRGRCWRPWWQTADLPGAIKLSDGTCGSWRNNNIFRGKKIKSNPWPLEGVWMCSMNVSACLCQPWEGLVMCLCMLHTLTPKKTPNIKCPHHFSDNIICRAFSRFMISYQCVKKFHTTKSLRVSSPH